MSRQILVPTNRLLTESRPLFESLSSGSKLYNLEGIICDNSGSIEKAEYLQKLFGSNFEVAISESCEALENWSNCLKKATAEFIQFVADDDRLIQYARQGFTYENLPKNVIAICPIVLLTTPNLGATGMRQFQIIDNTPAKRLITYQEQANGANSLLYAAWRRDLFENVHEVGETHPCSAGYQDWTVVRTMLIEGWAISDPASIYIYNNDNWFGPDEAIKAEIESLFARAE